MRDSKAALGGRIAIRFFVAHLGDGRHRPFAINEENKFKSSIHPIPHGFTNGRQTGNYVFGRKITSR